MAVHPFPSPRGLDDLDAPGRLSIVVQGGLGAGNLVETATHCRHWRELFPKAQIILALSVTDVLAARSDGGRLHDLRLVRHLRHDSLLAAALRVIEACCDEVRLSDGALPLPPIKDDSGPNNFNLQLAAAQAGLAAATGAYVLRIRSDAVFLTRDFLKLYARDSAAPRGDAAALQQRVLISWLFTLNPFTVERMPLHFSDWFHFGLLSDVRRLWRVPPMTLADSLHFRAHPQPADQNLRESRFHVRLGVEQHLPYHAFKPVFPGLLLEHHGDRRSSALALDILLDNFCLCDLEAARFVFTKYEADMTSPAMRHHCLTPDDWRRLVDDRRSDPRQVLAPQIRAARLRGYG